MEKTKKMEKTIDILVVEDSPLHQEAARESLKEYNVEIVSTFDEAMDKLGERETPYDAVLTDLLYTQGRGECISDKGMGSVEMPFGYSLAMIAAQKGVPYVGVITDTDHHAHPIAYTMDHLPEPMKVNDSVVAFGNINQHMLYKTPDGRIGTKEEVGEEFMDKGFMDEDLGIDFEVPGGSEYLKNWKSMLDRLMSYSTK